MPTHIPGQAEAMAEKAADPSWKVSQQGPATCFSVRRDDMEWGDIFVRHGTTTDARGQSNTWVTLAAHTTFGNFSHHWGALGNRDWREALSGLSMDYTMQKFMGLGWKVKDFEATVVDMRAQIAEARALRRENPALGGMTERESRELKRELREAAEAARDYLPNDELAIHKLYENLESEWLLTDFSPKTSYNPQGVGFWDKIWTPFVEQMSRELKQEIAAAERRIMAWGPELDEGVAETPKADGASEYDLQEIFDKVVEKGDDSMEPA